MFPCQSNSGHPVEQMVKLDQQERPNSIHQKQINREEDNCDKCNNCCVLYLSCTRPRHPVHFRAHVAQELAQASNGTLTRAGQTALAPRWLAFPASTKARSTRRRRHHRLVWVICLSHYFVNLLRHSLVPSKLAGVPGFEPGLSVLETDVLT